jgi:glycerol transport system permease protein
MKISSIIRIIFLVLIAFAFIFPLYFMIATSLTSKVGIEQGLVIPDFNPENYIPQSAGAGAMTEAITTGSWLTAIINSFQVTICAVAAALLISFPAAYVISRCNFVADKHVFFWFLATRMAPAAALIIPFLIIFRAAGIWDSLIGTTIAFCTFNVPISIWLFASFIGAMPKEVDDMAFIDGYSLWRFFRRILIPYCKPGILVVTFFAWFYSWSEMFFVSIITSANYKPLTAMLLITLGRMGYGVQWGLASAAGVVSMIPGLILLFWARNYLAKGFTFGRI